MIAGCSIRLSTPAEALGQEEDARRAAHGARALEAAADAERDDAAEARRLLLLELVARVLRETRDRRPRERAGWRASISAIARAFDSCARMRTKSVLMPRSVSHESNGPGTAPTAFCENLRRAQRSSRFVATNPPTTSLWPPTYFVVLCMTRSAPRSIGRCSAGLMNVLSTARSDRALLRERRDRPDVRDLEHRVRRRLDPDELRRGLDRALDRGEIARVHVGVPEPELAEHLLEDAERPAVDVVARDHVVAAREQRHERRDRAHPGREREAVLRVLERGEAGLERVARRVAGARVLVALVDARARTARRWTSGRSGPRRRPWSSRAPGRRGSRAFRVSSGDSTTCRDPEVRRHRVTVSSSPSWSRSACR